MLFCDVVASTELRQRQGDTRADAWFAGLFALIEAAVTASDGLVVKWLGDGAMAVFTSAGGALDAAVAVQQVAHGYAESTKSGGSPLRVGLSIGDAANQDGDWLGMPVVQAARLCDAAAADEILASDVVRILAGSRCTHAMASVGAMSLKGIDEPLTVVRVEWARAGPAAPIAFPAALESALRGPFVGRATVVAEALSSWQAGRWRAMFVAGEPGIGKTRLVAEFADGAHASGATVIVGRCDPDVSAPYRPWIEALSGLSDALSDEQFASLLAPQLAELTRLVPAIAQRAGRMNDEITVDADTRHAMIVDAVAALLELAAPIVVVLDDLHWIDRRSLQLLRHVVQRNLDGAVVVATYRDTDIDRSHALTATLADLRRIDGVKRVTLTGLDGPEVAAFFEDAAGRPLDRDDLALADAVHARTAGNPLFVGELFRHLYDGARSDTTADSALPTGLRELIERRLTDLGSEAVAALQVAAAIGSSFEIDVVEAVLHHQDRAPELADRGDVLELTEHARASGIVADVGMRFEFRHSIIRDVLVAGLSASRRQRLHRSIAAVLEQRWALTLDRHLDELAFHHGEGRTAEAPRWCLRAAQAAIDLLDSAAVHFADRGLELRDLAGPSTASDPELHCDLLIARAGGLRLEGVETLDEAQVAFDAAVRLDDQVRIAEALLCLSLRSAAESQVEHLDFLAHGLKHLSDDAITQRWNVETAFVLREFMDPASDPNAHRSKISRIIDHLDPSDTRACQIAMRCARSLTSTNQAPDARPITERFVANCAGVDTEGFPVEIALSTMWLHLGDRDSSDRCLATAARDPRRNYWFYDCQVLQREIMRDLLEGRWSEAASALAEFDRIGSHDANLILSSAAQTEWLRRETGDAEANIELVRSLIDAMPDFAVLRAMEVANLAELDDDTTTLRLLDELAPNGFDAVGRGWLTLLALGQVAWAAVAVDARQHARTLRHALSEYTGQIAVMATGTHALCAVDRLLAGLAAMEGDDDAADRLFANALAQDRSLRSRPLEARTLHWWGRALVRRGDTERGQETLRHASDLAGELGMPGVVRQIERLGIAAN